MTDEGENVEDVVRNVLEQLMDDIDSQAAAKSVDSQAAAVAPLEHEDPAASDFDDVDPFLKKLSENFDVVDVPHTYFNQKNGRHELRRRSSDWIRDTVCRFLTSNVNPDAFVRNVEKCFGAKMMSLLCEPPEFARQLTECMERYFAAATVGSNRRRPEYLMCLMTDYNYAWPTKFHFPSPVFRKTPATGGRSRTSGVERDDFHYFHRNANVERADPKWEHFVWNQPPAHQSMHVASSSQFRLYDEFERHNRTSKLPYHAGQSDFYPSEYDLRYQSHFAPHEFERSRSPIGRSPDPYYPPPQGSYASAASATYRYEAAAARAAPQRADYSYKPRRDYSSGYLRDWCGRHDVDWYHNKNSESSNRRF